MTQSEFFKIKTSGRPIDFARQIELRKSGTLPANQFLFDFCKKMHTSKAYVTIASSKTNILVYSKTEYRYELYPKAIVRRQLGFYKNEVRVYDLPENLWQK